jgi:hypothetical protein
MLWRRASRARRPWPRARRWPWTRRAPCATRADWPRGRRARRGQGELDVEQAAHADALGDRSVDCGCARSAGAERDRRQRARRVAGVDAGLLDVLHDAGRDTCSVAVVERRRRRSRWRRRGSGRRAPGARDSPRWRARGRSASVVVVVDDLHAASAEDVARAHEHRIADASAATSSASSKLTRCRAWARAGPASASTRPKAPRSSARSMASGEVPTIGTPSSLSALRQTQRRLPAELDDDAGDAGRQPSACTTSSTSSSVSGSK